MGVLRTWHAHFIFFYRTTLLNNIIFQSCFWCVRVFILMYVRKMCSLFLHFNISQMSSMVLKSRDWAVHSSNLMLLPLYQRFAVTYLWQWALTCLNMMPCKLVSQKCALMTASAHFLCIFMHIYVFLVVHMTFANE